MEKQPNTQPKQRTYSLRHIVVSTTILAIGVALAAALFTRVPGWEVWLAAGIALAVISLLAGYLYLARALERAEELDARVATLEAALAERQRAEITAAAASKAKADFFANMSHEIRTPLNAILGYAQILQRDARLSPEQTEAVDAIATSGNHLLGLINDILNISKIEAGGMELRPNDFDLNALVRGLEVMFKPRCAQKKLALRVQRPGDTPCLVHADEGVLRQVLINLLGNAVKFTASGEVYLGVKRAADERFQFEIIDTGVGIPAAEQARVFEPFYQGSNSQHRGGTGLGLTIAKRQVELLGGKIEFQSEPGFGTRFFFTIPLPPTREAIPAAPALPIEAEAELPPLDFSKLALSEDLCTQLTIAAELHSTTVLKSYLNDLRRLGPDGQLLAEHLRRLMRGYDMDGILKILTQIRVAEQKQNGAPPKT